jgi:rhodanese-related sulfurtransferase
MIKFITLLCILTACDYQDKAQAFDDPQIETLNVSDEDQLNIIYEKFKGYLSEFPNALNIKPDEAKFFDEPLFVDVREKKEYRVSMIKGAITKDEFIKNKDLYKYRNIIIYCTIGLRSGKFSQQLTNEGFTSFNLIGGVLLWSHYGFDFYNGDLLINRVHTYSKKWNHLHSDYQAIF